MFITKDRFGNPFKWSKKGKNRECEVKDNECIVRKCFWPEDCGSVDPKTQKKTIIGKCRTLHEKGCPKNYNDHSNFVVYDKRSDDVRQYRYNNRYNDMSSNKLYR